VSEQPGLRDRERDLPGLLGWGDELYEATLRAEQRPERRGRGGAGRRRRVPRRLAGVLALLALLLVPGAVATRSIWDDPVQRVGPRSPASASPAVRLAEGSAGDVRWRLGGWNASGGKVCLRTEAFRGGARVAVGSGCGVPQTRGRLTAFLAGAGGVSLVAGTAAPGARTVVVRPPAGSPVRVATVAVAAESLRRSGIAQAARVYVAVFPRGFGAALRAPAVRAYGDDGALIGATGPGA
jgi:hypothetical protein